MNNFYDLHSRIFFFMLRKEAKKLKLKANAKEIKKIIHFDVAIKNGFYLSIACLELLGVS